MEGIDELLKYVGKNFDKPLLKVIYFIEKAKLLESTMKMDKIKEGEKTIERPSSCLLEASYLRMCNTEFEKKDMLGEIFLQYLDFVLVESRSFWRFNIYNLESEFQTKCSYCNIPLKYCPMKVLSYIKKCIADENIDEAMFWNKIAGNDDNYIKDTKKIIDVSVQISSIVKDYLSLKGAEFLLDTEVVDIIEEKAGKVKYKYLDFTVNNISFINELNQYFSTPDGLFGELDTNNLNIKENYSYMFNQSPVELAVYTKYICEKNGVNYMDVLDEIYKKFEINEDELAREAYYKEYMNKVDCIEGASDLRKDLKEIFTYVKNYAENPKLPYIQFNLLVCTENTKTINDTVNVINRFFRMYNYLSKKSVLFVDVEMFIKMTKDNTDVFLQIDKLYNENDLIVFTNVHKIKYLNEFRVESFFIALGKYYNKTPKSTTILCGEKEIIYSFLKKYDNLMDTVFLHKLDVEGYELELVKHKILTSIEKVMQLDSGTKKDIENYIETTYQKGKDNEIEYIDKIVNEVVYSKYKHCDNEQISFNLENKKLVELNKALEKLDKLTGIVEVKHKVKEIIKYIEFNKKLGDKKPVNLNMMFKGNAGTGKTTVARIIGEILYSLGVVKSNKFIEVTSKDLIGDHLGQTSPKTQRVIDSALDGILFIDEAYSIMSSKGTADYPTECISTLCKAMEKQQDRLVVIFAGYTKEMNEFVNKNQGLMSRIAHIIEFEDFSKEELLDIFKTKVEEEGFELEPGIEDKVLASIAKNKLMRNFGNARFIDNMCEKLLLTHSLNYKDDEKKLKLFTCDDFDVMEKTVKSEERTIDDILSELNSLTGLKDIKEVLEGFVSTLEFNKKVNMQNEFNMHMIFKGNAGTGKTTVARLLAEIYYNLGYIKKNKLVEVQSQDLIGEYVGQTGPKTQNVIESAVDGVLFIDEAYAIMQHRGTGVSYTDECIATLLKAMEDYNGRLIIIFAGYTNEMIEFRDLNPGLKSRVGFELDFVDYSVEELLDIFINKSTAKGFNVTDKAKAKVEKILENAKEIENFGNGRFINNMIQKIIVEHAIKTRGNDDQKRLLTIEEEDINVEKLQPELSKRRIGF